MANDLWGDALPAPKPETERPALRKGNPLIAVYGAGPAGATCGTCVHLYIMRYHDYRYFKCDLRGTTHGPGTDMRKSWPACGRYQEKERDNG